MDVDFSVAIEGQGPCPLVELIDDRTDGRDRIEIGQVIIRKPNTRLTRGKGRCGEGCEGEHKCDKGCEVHDDDDEGVVKKIRKSE